MARKSGNSKRSADPRGAKISHRAVRHSHHLTPRTITVLAIAGLIVTGVALGVTIGVWFSPDDPPAVAVVPISDQSSEIPDGALPSGPPLPVEAYGSEQARRMYEESLANQPETLRPNPDAAPPLPPLVRETPTQAAAVPPTPLVSPTPPPNAVNPSPPEQRAPAAILPSEPVLSAGSVAAPDHWKANAVQVALLSDRPKIAIVFDDLGIDQPRSRQSIALPGPMTMAFLPYGYHLPEMVAAARQNGHEILVHVPMAPLDLSVDPGPHALQKELGSSEILNRLNWNLNQFSGFVGINNHMGSRFTADTDSMALVLAELKRRGLIYIDSVTTRDTKGFPLAAAMGLPYAVRDVFLDHDISREAIARQLARAEKTAQEQGYAIAIGHPHDETIEVVRDWLRSVEQRGFQLVPVSTIVEMRQQES